MSIYHPIAYSRRDFGKLVLNGLPFSLAVANSRPLLAAIHSRINGVRIGAITYSFRSMPDPEDIIKSMARIGLSEAELMSGDAEKLAGIPALPNFGRGGGRGRGAPPTTEEQAEMEAAQAAQKKWRASAAAGAFKLAKKKFNDAGIEVRLLCYNMNVKSTTDEDIEYAFMMAKGLGVRAISTSTQVSMAKRLAPFANKHKLMVGFHGHSNTNQPDEVSTTATFEAVMAASKYIGANLDIGHFTAANEDAVKFINQHHARITNLHLKDRKRDNGANTVWGQGDTPIKEVLLLLKKTKWDIPANIEFEYQGEAIAEVTRCYEYCKNVLA